MEGGREGRGREGGREGGSDCARARRARLASARNGPSGLPAVRSRAARIFLSLTRSTSCRTGPRRDNHAPPQVRRRSGPRRSLFPSQAALARTRTVPAARRRQAAYRHVLELRHRPRKMDLPAEELRRPGPVDGRACAVGAAQRVAFAAAAAAAAAAVPAAAVPADTCASSEAQAAHPGMFRCRRRRRDARRCRLSFAVDRADAHSSVERSGRAA